jgi:hypothetical protein
MLMIQGTCACFRAKTVEISGHFHLRFKSHDNAKRIPPIPDNDGPGGKRTGMLSAIENPLEALRYPSYRRLMMVSRKDWFSWDSY